MAATHTLKFTSDEIEILIDALEADQEGYEESAKEARGNNRRSEVATYTEAAARIGAVLEKLRPLID